MEPYAHAPGSAELFATKLCGSDYYQVVPGGRVSADFNMLAARLGLIGEVKTGPLTLSFKGAGYEIIIFQDGRAMIKNAVSGDDARSVYTEYVGL